MRISFPLWRMNSYKMDIYMILMWLVVLIIIIIIIFIDWLKSLFFEFLQLSVITHFSKFTAIGYYQFF